MKLAKRQKMELVIGALMMMSTMAMADSAVSNSKERGQRGPRIQLTETQRQCLDELVGAPGEGERPSREVMDAAFAKCGVEKPAFKEKQKPELTEAQRSCLDSKLGVPGEGEPPTHEEFAAAATECGIEKI